MQIMSKIEVVEEVPKKETPIVVVVPNKKILNVVVVPKEKSLLGGAYAEGFYPGIQSVYKHEIDLHYKISDESNGTKC